MAMADRSDLLSSSASSSEEENEIRLGYSEKEDKSNVFSKDKRKTNTSSIDEINVESPAKRVKLNFRSESDSSVHETIEFSSLRKQNKSWTQPHLLKSSSMKQHQDNYSSVSQRIMASMGYQFGRGLGKFGTGITRPVEESIQKGRRGLGYMLEGLEKEDVQWELEEVHYDQHPEWLDYCGKPIPTLKDFAGWITVGNKKVSIDDETQFCDPDILQRILDGKTVFDSLSEKEFLDARQRSNPFETIKGAIFQNRAAMKMANIDAVFDFMFTNPKNLDGKNLLGPYDVLYFADICAGPGGFSEYVLWRKKWHARGFGMTLKDPDDASDFKLDKFLACPCETFDPHYGVNGYDGDGDITKPENLTSFQEYVMTQTEGKGVHFVMGDGGISVEGQENIQEILTKQLVLCQYICALSILRTGGHFVCKVFDMFTPFSAGLFYLLYRCFQTVCLFKPVTSRPANSERYVVCKNLMPGHEAVHEYLFAVNEELIKLHQTSLMDIHSVVPSEAFEDEINFISYLRAFNDSFGINQALHLKKLQYFVKNVNLHDTRQAEIRKKCLDIWKVPNSPRTAPSETSPLQLFYEFWSQLSTADFQTLDSKNFTIVDKDSVEFLKDVHSWKCYFACGKRMMIVGVGRNMVYAWDMKGNKPSFMAKPKELNGLELPKGTVLEVEFVQELKGEGRGQKKQETVYVVDVIAINGLLFGNKPLKERQLYTQKLCKVVNKPCRRGAVQLKAKELYRVADLNKQLNKLCLKECKGHSGSVPTYPISDDGSEFISPVGIIFLKSIKDPWQLHLSKSGRLYYFNSQNGQSQFECPASSVASYMSVLESRHIWMFKKSMHGELCSSSSEATVVADALTKQLLGQIIQQFLKS